MSLNKKLSGSAILTTIFLLFGILTVALIGLEIIMSGLASRRAQGASAQAFWAAEAGIERASLAFKNSNSCSNDAGKFCVKDEDCGLPNTCILKVAHGNEILFQNCLSAGADGADGAYLKFCNGADCDKIDADVGCSLITNPGNKTLYHMGGDVALPSYWVKVKLDGRNVALTSQGNFLTTSRQIYVKFCLPSCNNKFTNDPDGCGGTCK